MRQCSKPSACRRGTAQIQYPDRLARLLLVMALALYSAVSTGLWDEAHHPSPAEKKF
jgi:hypothetical protein